MITIDDKKVLLTGDGQYRLGCSFTAISANWEAAGIAPAGVLTFSVDGDPGDPAGVMDLAAGSRCMASNQPLAFVDVELAGLPDGGMVTLYFR